MEADFETISKQNFEKVTNKIANVRKMDSWCAEKINSDVFFLIQLQITLQCHVINVNLCVS